MSASTEPPDPDPWRPFEADLLAQLSAALAAIGAPTETAVIQSLLDFDGGPQGDAALPVHRLAAGAHVAPGEFADQVLAAIRPKGNVESVSAQGAYLNFVADPSRLDRPDLAYDLRARA